MDYKDQRQKRTLHAYMIPPTNLDDMYGELTGVMWETLSITAAYYTDARTSGTLQAKNSNYIKNSFIRIVVEDDDGNEQELGTYAVSNDVGRRVNGAYIQTFILVSRLHTLSLDYLPDNLIAGKGTIASTVFKKTLTDVGMDESDYDISCARDYRYGSNMIMEAGASRLSRLFDIAKQSNNRLDVDGHGRVTLTPYVLPNDRTPILTLDTSDKRGIIHDGIDRDSTWKDTPSRSIAVYDYTEASGDDAKKKHMYAIAWNSKADARGYWVTDYQQVNDLNPPTQEKLAAIAKNNMAANLGEKTEWSFTSQFIPDLWEGDVIELIVNDDLDDYTGARKCLVSNIEISGPYLNMDITLKETTGGDDE